MHAGEAFKSIDLHLIHNLTIDRLYEQFLKRIVADTSFSFKDPFEYTSDEI